MFKTKILVILLIASVAALVSIGGCATGQKPPVQQIDEPDTEEEFNPYEAYSDPMQEYRIRAGDKLALRSIYNWEVLNVEVMPVRADGMVSLPVIGDVEVVGKTLPEVNELTMELYNEYVVRTGQGRFIMPGDELHFRFAHNPELNQRAFVRPDGTVALLLVGTLKAEGKTFLDFEKEVQERYGDFLKEPKLMMILLATRTRKIHASEGDITVLLVEAQPMEVFVGGEVGEPAIVTFKERLTPWQALTRVKGVLASGNIRNVIYITRGPDGGAITTKLDLKNYLKRGYYTGNLYLRHGDILLVPRTGIAKLNVWVQQYIRDTLPIHTSFTFSYAVNRRELERVTTVPIP